MSLNKSTNQKGFTLVEMIIALTLFSLVVAMSTGALVGLFDANRKSQSLASVINNLNYSIENMTRTIRFAKAYNCGAAIPLTTPVNCTGNPTPPGESIAVTSGSGTTIFRFNNSNSKLEISTNNGTTYTPITSSEVTITYAKFFVYNTASGEGRQPYALIIIRGYAGSKPSSRSEFDIQTIVSQRPLDL